jgi:hypothetical protein
MQHDLETDYLVVGAGAMGMAFVDELLLRDRKARVILLDRRSKPGGHWNDAYSFVRLHQPAAWYGVSSEKLGQGGDELASRDEILAYYERVLQKHIASGRVRFFPLSNYTGDGRWTSLVDPDGTWQASVNKRVVDGTYGQIRVPASHEPNFPVEDGVAFVPINAIATLRQPYQRYVVIGAGKTGMDALLFLMSRGVDPARLTWIMSHDAWWVNRAKLMRDQLPYDGPIQLRCILDGTDVDDIFRRLEEKGSAIRLDPAIWPTKHRCATVSTAELSQLRQIDDVVRLGRVKRIQPARIVLADGSLATDERTLHIDCTANGLTRRPEKPVFDDDTITLQPVFLCQPAFSAAAIAKVETLRVDDARKNVLCTPVPHPEKPIDYLRALGQTIANTIQWGEDSAWWFVRCRLSFVRYFSFIALLTHVFRMLPIRQRGIDKVAALETNPSTETTSGLK